MPLESLLGVWVFFLGTAIGSFINVVVLRHEAGKRITGRSGCPSCGKQLTWKELVPIVSYLAQRGKCVGCGARISLQYPLVELATGLLFVLVFLHVIGSSPTSNLQPLTYAQLLLELCVWSVLMVITVYDLRTKLIPDIFSYSFAALALCLTVVNAVLSDSLIPHLLTPTSPLFAGPILFLPFYLLWKISDGRWIGLGDGKLALGIGWLLGFEHGGSAILLSFWIGAGFALILMAAQRIVGFIRRYYSLQPTPYNLGMKSEIPFGPFMVLATLYAYLTGFSILTLVL